MNEYVEMDYNRIYDNFIFIKKYIKKLIDDNNKIIKENNLKVNDILKIENVKERQNTLTYILNINKNLIKENNNLLILYNGIVEIIDKKLSIESYNNLENIDYFELTINGAMDYNEKHKFFNDDNFFNKLLEYYKNIENYEYCNYLLKIKNKK